MAISKGGATRMTTKGVQMSFDEWMSHSKFEAQVDFYNHSYIE